jgi:peptidoglycan/xylan/chitin deacetylase (PgdA/CDA1 family)
VLCYHRIGGPLELGVTRVARAGFARHMTALARAGWRSLRLAEVARLVREPDAPLAGPPAFLLTFDDGYASLADYAYPLLRDLGFTPVTFLVTDYVGGTNVWDVRYTRRRLAHLDWGAAERWQACGFEFASHTASHARLTWLGDEEAAEELERSRAALVRRLGPAAGRAVAYPFGACDARIERLAAAAGYEVGFGGVRASGRPLALPRLPVYCWDAGAVPLGLRRDRLGALARTAAHLANRCAVGTSWLLRLGQALGRAPATADSPR